MKHFTKIFLSVTIVVCFVVNICLITSCEKEEEVKKPEPANTNQQPEQNDTTQTGTELADTASINDTTDSELDTYKKMGVSGKNV